jgi:hypothetical protein
LSCAHSRFRIRPRPSKCRTPPRTGVPPAHHDAP